MCLTCPPYPDEHGDADEVDKLQRGVKRKHGVPKDELLLKREFTPEKETYPASIGCICILCKTYGLLVLFSQQRPRHRRQGLGREYLHEEYLWKDLEGFEMVCQLRVHAHQRDLVYLPAPFHDGTLPSRSSG